MTLPAQAANFLFSSCSLQSGMMSGPEWHNNKQQTLHCIAGVMTSQISLSHFPHPMKNKDSYFMHPIPNDNNNRQN